MKIRCKFWLILCREMYCAYISFRFYNVVMELFRKSMETPLAKFRLLFYFMAVLCSNFLIFSFHRQLKRAIIFNLTKKWICLFQAMRMPKNISRKVFRNTGLITCDSCKRNYFIFLWDVYSCIMFNVSSISTLWAPFHNKSFLWKNLAPESYSFYDWSFTDFLLQGKFEKGFQDSRDTSHLWLYCKIFI